MAKKKYELIKESKITESREIGTDLSHLTKYNEYDKDRGEYVSYYKPESIEVLRKEVLEKNIKKNEINHIKSKNNDIEQEKEKEKNKNNKEYDY